MGKTKTAKRKTNLSSPRRVKSLFAYVRFADFDVEREALRHKVSAGILHGHKDANGNDYPSPFVEHVALTNYPAVPELSGWELLETVEGETVYRKEILYSGTFRLNGQDEPLIVTESGLEVAAENFEAAKANGLSVPLQGLHEGDGHQKADVIALTVADTIKYAQVSDELSAVQKSSLTLSNKKAANMSMQKVAEILGVPTTDATSDALEQNVLAAISEVKAGTAKLSEELAAVKTELSAAKAAATQKTELSDAAKKLPASIVTQVAESRKTLLSGLVTQGVISPAQSDAAAAELNTEDAVRLDLSRSEGEPSAFDTLMGILSKGGSKWKESGRSETNEEQERTSLSGKSEISPLAAARKRAAGE